jgi:hypothetical protein
MKIVERRDKFSSSVYEAMVSAIPYVDEYVEEDQLCGPSFS